MEVGLVMAMAEITGQLAKHSYQHVVPSHNQSTNVSKLDWTSAHIEPSRVGID